MTTRGRPAAGVVAVDWRTVSDIDVAGSLLLLDGWIIGETQADRKCRPDMVCIAAGYESMAPL
jgi:hypothetical protein